MDLEDVGMRMRQEITSGHFWQQKSWCKGPAVGLPKDLQSQKAKQWVTSLEGKTGDTLKSFKSVQGAGELPCEWWGALSLF